MKNSFFIACLIFLAFATSTSLYSQDLEDANKWEDIFVVVARNGIINVVNDTVKFPVNPLGSSPQMDLSSLKEAWKKCYGALLTNQKDTLNSFFVKGVPSGLPVNEKHDGQVIFLMVSRVEDTIRLVLKIEVTQPRNGLYRVYDAHIWRMNDKGKWEVESSIYQ